MKLASLLGLSLGWALTALAAALSLPTDDPLFWPSLAISLPAVVGLIAVLRARRSGQHAEPLSMPRVVGFGVLGALIATVAVLATIAGLYWNKPVPGEEQAGVVVDERAE